MNRRRDLALRWRERIWLWLPALVFALLNVTLLVYYQASGIGAEVGLLEQRINAATQREQRLAAQVAELTELAREVELNRRRVVELYDDRLATQAERLTAVIAEVRRLAKEAGMAPSAVSYPQQEIGDYGLIETSFVFNVEGSYADLRRFINSLELTPSFLTLERISLSGDDGSAARRLNIALRISTLFAADDVDFLEADFALTAPEIDLVPVVMEEES